MKFSYLSTILIIFTLLSLSDSFLLSFPKVLSSISGFSDVGDFQSCNATLSSLTSSNLSLYQQGLRERIYIYSGHNINDLGDFQACNNYSDLRYITLNFSYSSYSGFFGICGPVQCEASDYDIVWELLAFKYPELDNAIVGFTDPTQVTPTGGPSLIVAIAILSLMMILTVTGTIVTYVLSSRKGEKKENAEKQRLPSNLEGSELNLSLIDGSNQPKPPKKPEGTWQMVFGCFDIVKNYDDLIKDEINPAHDNNLRVFNLVRVLAFSWVVFGHTMTFYLGYAKNLFASSIFINSVWFLTTYAGLFAVDLFYFMSGFFGGYMLIQKVKTMKCSLLNFFKIFLHRFLRIWPSYVVCILFFWKILPYLGSGPLWQTQLTVSSKCKNYWWHNMLFIDNFDGAYSESCYDWGWYLSTDFQMFLIVPIICWAYHYSKDLGRSLIWLLILISISVSYALEISTQYYYKFPPVYGQDTYYDYYIDPVVRCAPYYIGAGLGIMYKKYKSDEEKNFYNFLEKRPWACYLSSLCGLGVTLFLVYYPRVIQNGNPQWSEAFGYTWMALERPLYVTAFFMIFVPVLSGNFSFMRDVFGSSFFSLLAKLTFTLYLVHYQILGYMFYSDSQTNDINTMNFYLRTLATILVSLVVAAILHLFVEKPFSNLEVKVLNPKKAARSNEAKIEEVIKAKLDVQDAKV